MISYNKIKPILFFVGYTAFTVKSLIMVLIPAVYSLIPNGLFGGIQILCFVMLIFGNRLRINRTGIKTLVAILLVIIWNSLIAIQPGMLNELLTKESMILAFTMMLYYMTERDFQFLLKWFRKISYFMIAYYVLMYFTGSIVDEYGYFSYMGFGYGVALYVCVIMQKAFEERRIKDVAITVLLSFLIIISGNRGSYLQLAICFLILFIRYLDMKRKIIWVCVITFALLFLLVCFEPLISTISVMLQRYGIQNTLMKRLVSQELFLDSGRSQATGRMWDMILNRPFLGYGVGIDRTMLGIYPHNFVIELWLNFGFILGSLLVLWILAPIRVYITNKGATTWDNTYLVMYISIVVMLLLSNSLYSCPSFWTLTGMSCSYCCKSHKKRVNGKGYLHKLTNNEYVKESSYEKSRG